MSLDGSDRLTVLVAFKIYSPQHGSPISPLQYHHLTVSVSTLYEELYLDDGFFPTKKLYASTLITLTVIHCVGLRLCAGLLPEPDVIHLKLKIVMVFINDLVKAVG